MSAIIPAFRYKDARKAIDFLCGAFGFEKHAVYEAEDGSILHAELAFGDGFVMLGSDRDDALPLRSPGNDRVVAAATYVVVPDADLHCAQAKAAGAEIVMEIYDTPYGSREYSARDLEGNMWSFGTYAPG